MKEQTIRAIAKIIEKAAREICEVIDIDHPAAKPAFEAPKKAAVYPVGPRPPKDAPFCSACGTEMIIGKNSGRYYCDPCFVERKKAKGEWR